MNKKYFFLSFTLVVLIAGFYLVTQDANDNSSVEDLRAQHAEALENSPFNATKELSRDERKALGLPPNAYNEQMWENTMDPATGRPMPERIFKLQDKLKRERQGTRGVGGDANNPWIDRGPNNVGGRTRGIMFDPNDINNERVFAGGVSGGLWVNDDITDPNSAWSLVPGIGANISVRVIIADPNDSMTFYIGSGESYTSGQALGRGIWKSSDGGVTWSNIFGGYTGMTGTQLIDGVFYINDIIARDVGATTELYASVAGSFFRYASSPNNFHGLSEQGLYKSVDNGVTWNRISILDGSGNQKNPNDLELDINNNIWLTITGSSWGTSTTGDIYRSTDGVTFTLMGSVPAGIRVEIEPDPSNANALWALANVPGSTQQADFFDITYNSGPNNVTITPMASEPADVDTGIPNTDFTRGQAWYDLEIESDANGNLLVGGIDLFRSTDGGTTWTQISKWSNNNNLAALGVSLVHADQQAIVFRPGNDNQVVFGNDGGIFYSGDIANAASSTSNITSRNVEYNVVQFYYGDIASVVNGAGDDFIGGTQDNGTPFIINAPSAGTNSSFDLTGGDGGFTEIDDAGAYIISTYPRNNHFVTVPPSSFYRISSGGSNGSFINEAGLDKNLDILYSNSTSGATNRIERNATFTGGAGLITRTQLTDALLNAPPRAFKVSPFTLGSTTLFVGLANGRLLRLDNADGTPTWNNITGPSFVGSVSDIEFGQSEQEIFVTMHNYGVTNVWFTSDGGGTWASKDGNLPDLPVKCVLQNPLLPTELIVGTELGVWATADYTQPSPVWIQTFNGMSDVTVLDLDLRASDNVILASTHGRGFFTSQFTSSPLSVNTNNFDENTIKLYPTVSNGELTLATNRALGIIDFNVYDLNGREVYATKFDMSTNTRDINLTLNAGIYIVKIESDNSSITKKIIIK